MKTAAQNKHSENGDYTADTLLTALNIGKRGDARINKKQLLHKLRRAGFLGTGQSTRKEDPIHNKAPRWVIEKGWAKNQTQSYLVTKGQNQIEVEYKSVLVTTQGLPIVERILNEPEFSLLSLKQQHQQTEQPTTPALTPEQKKASAQAAAKEISAINSLLKAS